MTTLTSDHVAPIASNFLERWQRENLAHGWTLFLQAVPTGKTRIEVKATASGGLKNLPVGIIVIGPDSLKVNPVEVNVSLFRDERLPKLLTELEACRERDNLTADLEKQALTDEEIADMLCFREDVKRGLKNPTFEDKRYYLEQLQIKVVIKGEEATFTCRLPIGRRVFRIRGTQIP